MSLMLQLCFCIIMMLNSWTSLLIRNDFWIFNDFLMLYCSIRRKDCFIIKLFVAVVDFAKRKLSVCFWSSRICLTFWSDISSLTNLVWALFSLSRYSRKKSNWLIFSWILLFVMQTFEKLDCTFLAWLLLSSQSLLNLTSSINLRSLRTSKNSRTTRVCNCIWMSLNI